MAPGSVCVGTPASADTRMGVDVSAGGSVETSPYLTEGVGTDLAGSLDVAPWLRVSNDITTADLRANLALRQFTRNANGTDISAGVNATASHRLSPYVSINGGVNYLTSRNGINSGFVNINPNDPVPPPTLPLPDPSLIGTRIRSHTMSASVGASAQLSQFDQIGASVTASRATNNSADGGDFNFLNGSLNYSRILSERTSVTASVRLGKSDYLQTRVGDGTIITPEVGFERTISETITVSASVGASFSSSTRADGTTIKSTSLSGQLRACRNQENSGICLVAMRSAQPTALGSISTVTSASLGYDQRVSRRDSINVSLGFNRSHDDETVIRLPETSTHYSVAGTWTRIFSPRFSAFVSPGYFRISNSIRRSDNFRLAAGLRYSFGAIS